ncbi:hypothetical protein J6590_044197 [Homalodisca vitripennis]|nr:hypothetical protein J6590_044197 [Homalodisca vitripennis]
MAKESHCQLKLLLHLLSCWTIPTVACGFVATTGLIFPTIFSLRKKEEGEEDRCAAAVICRCGWCIGEQSEVYGMCYGGHWRPWAI